MNVVNEHPLGQAMAVVVRCADGHHRIAQLSGKQPKQILGYLQHIQGRGKLVVYDTPMVVLELESALELNRMATRKPPTLRAILAGDIRAALRRCGKFAAYMHSGNRPSTQEAQA